MLVSLTGGLVMHLLMGSLIWSGTRYVGEYRPAPPLALISPLAAAIAAPAEAAADTESGEPSGGGGGCDMGRPPADATADWAAAEAIIILVVWSGEYIMPAAYMVKANEFWVASWV